MSLLSRLKNWWVWRNVSIHKGSPTPSSQFTNCQMITQQAMKVLEKNLELTKHVTGVYDGKLGNPQDTVTVRRPKRVVKTIYDRVMEKRYCEKCKRDLSKNEGKRTCDGCGYELPKLDADIAQEAMMSQAYLPARISPTEALQLKYMGVPFSGISVAKPEHFAKVTTDEWEDDFGRG